MESNKSPKKKMSIIVINNIKYFRTKAGLSEEELSLKIGKKENFIKRLENLEFKREPTIDLIDKVAKVLNIKAQDFFVER